MKNLIDTTDLSLQQLDDLMACAVDIDTNPQKYAHIAEGKILGSLFFEPSTRTRLSFESAFLRLGGKVVGFDNAAFSSTAKGESLVDTISTVSNYVDLIAMRHYVEGAAYAATLVSSVPVVNAGDGGHCHPTQTLADLLTIKREMGRLNNLTVGICGDLLFGRAVHSLINALVRYPDTKLVLISPPELKLSQDYVKQTLDANNISYKTATSIVPVISELDILYMTRIQRERFDDAEMYQRLKSCYELKKADLKTAKQDMRILHPLPRVTEINPDVDSDFRAAYFRQTKNGMLMRMALMKLLLEQDKTQTQSNLDKPTSKTCTNKKCVATLLPHLPKLCKVDADGDDLCSYCEKKLID